MSILEKLTEGVVNRDMRKEGAALLEKWEKTGLLEGISQESEKHGMARLLENQAKELLREAASTMSGGDVEGFAAVAFPIVRRVFGSLIANELVSVQPMSLPSGLIFFLDFTFQGTTAGPNRLGFDADTSLYGGGAVGSQITGGVNLLADEGNGAGQFYNLTNGYSSPTGSTTAAGDGMSAVLLSGALGLGGTTQNNSASFPNFGPAGSDAGYGQLGEAAVNGILQFDPDLTSGSAWCVVEWTPTAGQQLSLIHISEPTRPY